MFGPRNTPHLVQQVITWTGPRSNGPSELVQGIHSHTQNGAAACETAAFIGTLKSVLRRKYRLWVHIVNNNPKIIYEILLNAMFLQCKH